jgi:hypothetical protein
MSDIGKPERETQRRVIALFRDELGYRFDYPQKYDVSRGWRPVLSASALSASVLLVLLVLVLSPSVLSPSPSVLVLSVLAAMAGSANLSSSRLSRRKKTLVFPTERLS